jgi:hypothetical protein
MMRIGVGFIPVNCSTGSVQVRWRSSASRPEKHAPRQALTYDHYRLAVFAIKFVEIASGDQRHAERAEESGRDDTEHPARVVFL